VGVGNLISGPLSVALEFVLQLVDFEDPTARRVGWIVAALLAGITLLLYVRRWRGGSSRAFELGKDMLQFVRMRESIAPPPTPPPRFGLSFFHARERRLSSMSDRESHDAETMSLWKSRFSKKLSSTLARLHNSDLIDQAEARRLLLPESPTEVKTVAFRLIDLGCQDG
jgi:hypothetical protein